MTSEVAIVNPNAVAIAADSAVTVGDQKIYNSALKVFALSKTAPVGVMVYGNAGLHWVPWETIIKLYRSNLGNRRFETLESYAKDFLGFIENTPDLVPKAMVDDWVQANARGYFGEIRDEIIKRVGAIIKANGSVTDAQTRTTVQEVTAEHHEDLKKRDVLTSMRRGVETAIRTKYRDTFREIAKEVFQGLMPRGRHVSKLIEIATWLHTRNIFSNAASGVVVAGFGEKEIYPSVVTYEVEGLVESRLKCRILKEKCYAVVDGQSCGIIAFAQEDMVSTFMQGMNPAVRSFINRYLRQVFSRLPELIKDADIPGTASHRRSVKTRIRKDANSLLQTFFEQLEQHGQMEHVQPILQMVNVLPKDELAAMAEALVNLTAFKRRLTHTLETVGGPIDVAVISKGDGLVWVKRKHYFPAELNQHFFANYYRELKDGN